MIAVAWTVQLPVVEAWGNYFRTPGVSIFFFQNGVFLKMASSKVGTVLEGMDVVCGIPESATYMTFTGCGRRRRRHRRASFGSYNRHQGFDNTVLTSSLPRYEPKHVFIPKHQGIGVEN